MPLDGDAKPLTKTSQLARGPKRTTRQVAGTKRWTQIADAKQGPCRVCGTAPPNQMHHLISRGQGGADTEANIAPLCLRCHELVERRDPIAGMMLAASLTDAEYSYAIHHYGEGFFTRRLGIEYERPYGSRSD